MQKINDLFKGYCEYLKENDIKVVMPTFYPQRGEILLELSERGVECYILGGKEGVQLFKGIEQHGLEKDTTGMAETEEEQYQLVLRLPKALQKKGTKLVIHGYEQYNWHEKIKEKFKDVEIISHTAQNTYKFFEEKQNLKSILEEAHLQEQIIPSEVYRVQEILNEQSLENIYEKLRNQNNGKIVIQNCGEGHQEAGGGKSTYIVETLADFKRTVKEIQNGYIKVAKFITGAESNLSFFCSTTQQTEQFMIRRPDIDPKTSGFYGEKTTIKQLLNDSNVQEDSLYTIVGKATAKCVSCDLLTSSVGNGVGNDVGYIFEDLLMAKIQKIGEKLGKLMAKCGKSGLAGCDLIITAENEIYINEINDRQQGPSDQMSADAEKNGILSISKLAFLTAHCTFEQDDLEFLKSIKEQAAIISQNYLKNTGNFYIKLNSMHSTDFEMPYTKLNPYYADGKNAQVQQDFKFTFAHTLNKGFYKIHRENKDSPWVMDLEPVKLENGLQALDITTNEIFVKLDGQTKENDSITTCKQMLRIEGKAVKGSAPFLMQNGQTILNHAWEPILKVIYDTVVKNIEGAEIEKGDCYQELNPLLQERLFKEREPKFKSLAKQARAAKVGPHNEDEQNEIEMY